MTFHSSNKVDEKVKELGLLPDFGYACDVGANDGVFFSNTLHFEEEGWIVLCVEPNPLLEIPGRERRKLWRQVAAGAQDLEEHDFYTWGGYPYASNSALGFRYSPHQADSQQFKVKVRTLDRILEEAGFPRLDYLTVDVEGWEKEVFAGFTIQRWKPKVIVFEDFRGDCSVIVDRLCEEGYTDHGKLEFDRIFAREW